MIYRMNLINTVELRLYELHLFEPNFSQCLINEFLLVESNCFNTKFRYMDEKL